MNFNLGYWILDFGTCALYLAPCALPSFTSNYILL